MQTNRLSIDKALVKNSLYEFIKYFWSTFEGQTEFLDFWLMEYQSECFMYTARKWLPKKLTDTWITDEEYKELKTYTGGSCPVRDKPDALRHNWMMPPRHAKSITHNVTGPVWLNLHAGKNICSVSHSDKFAEDFNLKRQMILNSDLFKQMFSDEPGLNIKINQSKKIILENGARLMTSSMNKITGKGTNLLVNDDLTSEEEARTDKSALENAKEYYKRAMPSRLNDPRKDIIWNIQQRLAPNDVAGMILNDPELSERYTHTIIKAITTETEVIIFPCSGKVVIRKPGQKEEENVKLKLSTGKIINCSKKNEFLWYEMHTDYSSLKAESGSGVFKTQYNQEPINDDETYIKPHMINWITYDEYVAKYESSDNTMEYLSYDFSIKDKESSDFTGFVRLKKNRAKTAILDAFEEKMNYVQQNRFVISNSKKHKSAIHIIEDKANGSPILTDLSNDVQGMVAFNPGTRSKDTRVDISSIYFDNGNIEFVLNKDGTQPKGLQVLIERLTNFPFVDHDDLVDATTQAILYLYTDIDRFMYRNVFDENNIISEYNEKDKLKVVGIHKNLNEYNLLELCIDYNDYSFTVVNEHYLSGFPNEVLEKLINICKSADSVVELGDEITKLSLNTEFDMPFIVPNESKIEDSIYSISNGLQKNKIRIMKHCELTIRDIEIQRWEKSSLAKGRYKPSTLNDGFVGCLRAIINENLGENATFY